MIIDIPEAARAYPYSTKYAPSASTTRCAPFTGSSMRSYVFRRSSYRKGAKSTIQTR
jgi:hypothetical protein